jgi:2-polyprenyl-6-methoxyphenol hydroxylase-like FAD-dependent oxidoreductase
MTMYRGEAANHGILDVYHLVQSLQTFHDGKKPQKQALEEYESELRQRTNPAVLLSRQACLDAHDFNGLDRHSAVLKQRAINTKDL